MNEQLELGQVREDLSNQADQTLLNRLRDLATTDKPLAGLPGPQQVAVIARMIELLDTGDRDSLPSAIGGFTEGFRLAHDYVANHGALWIPRAPETSTKGVTDDN